MINVTPRGLHNFALPAPVRGSDSGWSKMVILDVSASHFRLKGAHALRPGELIEVWWEGFSVLGEVRRSLSDECSVRTLEPLALEQLGIGQLTSDRQATSGARTIQLRPIQSGDRWVPSRMKPAMMRPVVIAVIAVSALASAVLTTMVKG